MPKLITCFPLAESLPRRVSGHRPMTQRRAACLVAAGLWLALLAGCGNPAKWHSIDVSGSLPPLSFTMARASDGKETTEADYRGKIVLLYFGYTNCPDQCPTTLSNLAEILRRLGPAARLVRALFVSVDPNRDTPPVLAAYVRNFAPQIEGLRGPPDQLAALARRYRVVYSVTPATNGHPYEVTHSSAIYVFDGSGAARLIIASLDSTTPDIAGTTADLKRLVDEAQPQGLLARLRRLL
ncbi:MAG TPA: SCO family protein [Stellaceae bacterium]|jgi:protein SCO1/2|nr:SCO family protein [Stellaceae bacterium]